MGEKLAIKRWAEEDRPREKNGSSWSGCTF